MEDKILALQSKKANLVNSLGLRGEEKKQQKVDDLIAILTWDDAGAKQTNKKKENYKGR